MTDQGNGPLRPTWLAPRTTSTTRS